MEALPASEAPRPESSDCRRPLSGKDPRFHLQGSTAAELASRSLLIAHNSRPHLALTVLPKSAVRNISLFAALLASKMTILSLRAAVRLPRTMSDSAEQNRMKRLRQDS